MGWEFHLYGSLCMNRRAAGQSLIFSQRFWYQDLGWNFVRPKDAAPAPGLAADIDRSGLAEARSDSNDFWCFGKKRLLNVAEAGGAEAIGTGLISDRGMNAWPPVWNPDDDWNEADKCPLASMITRGCTHHHTSPRWTNTLWLANFE